MHARSQEEWVEVDGERKVPVVLTVPPRFQSGHSPALVLAHSSGSGKDDPLFRYMHVFLAARGFLTVRFDFPYRHENRKLPDREPVLEATFRNVLERVRTHPRWTPGPLFAGGRSLGGRMASHMAAQGERLCGLVLLAYPLQPPGRPDRRRDKHLASLGVPALFLSGTRDALAPREVLEAVVTGVPRSTLRWLDLADHSFRVPRSAGLADEDVHRRISETVADWMEDVLAHAPPGP